MLISNTQLLCTMIPTAGAARCAARIALDAGDYGGAASYYVTAAERLGNRALLPLAFGRQLLEPENLSQCALAAYRTAVEEGQQVKREPAAVERTLDETGLRLFVGSHHLYNPLDGSLLRGGHRIFTTEERLLLMLHIPHAASNLMPDLVSSAGQLYFPANRGIRLLFLIRYLAAIAKNRDNRAINRLGQMAIHSDEALRTLCRLAANGVEEASLELSMVGSERHSILANYELMRREQADFRAKHGFY